MRAILGTLARRVKTLLTEGQRGGESELQPCELDPRLAAQPHLSRSVSPPT
jgi:hypothetical protein